jgi:hypothetical protein
MRGLEKMNLKQILFILLLLLLSTNEAYPRAEILKYSFYYKKDTV